MALASALRPRSRALIIDDLVTIGPQCFVADSRSRVRLILAPRSARQTTVSIRQTVKVCVNDEWIDTGLEKLGCLIGACRRSASRSSSFPAE